MRSASMRAGSTRRANRRPVRSASCGRNRPLNRLFLFLSRRSSDQPIPNRLLSCKLAHAAHGIGFLSRGFLARRDAWPASKSAMTLIGDQSGQHQWADRLARILKEIEETLRQEALIRD